MSLQPREEPLLELLARCYLMTAKQIRERIYPDVDSKVSRRRLNEVLTKERYLSRYPKKTNDPRPAVYYLADRGVEHLTKRLDNDAYLAKPTTLNCRADHIAHTVEVGQILLAIEESFAAQDSVRLAACFHEFEPVNPRDNPADQRRMYTEFNQRPRHVCMPDAGFLIQRGLSQVVYFLEHESGRGTGYKDMARRKWKGYATLYDQAGHRGLFPATTWDGFLVLVVCPEDRWRDRFATQMARVLKEKHRQDLLPIWRSVSFSDMLSGRFLTDPVVRRLDKSDLNPLVDTNTPLPRQA